MGRIIRLTALRFDGTAIDGSASISFTEPQTQRGGQSDSEMGMTTRDTIGREMRGSISVADEDVFITLGDGATAKLEADWLEAGGVSKTLTIGDSVRASGVVFTRHEFTFDSDSEQQIEVKSDFVGIYPDGATASFGSQTAVEAGTVLASIE